MKHCETHHPFPVHFQVIGCFLNSFEYVLVFQFHSLLITCGLHFSPTLAIHPGNAERWNKEKKEENEGSTSKRKLADIET